MLEFRSMDIDLCRVLCTMRNQPIEPKSAISNTASTVQAYLLSVLRTYEVNELRPAFLDPSDSASDASPPHGVFILLLYRSVRSVPG